MRLPPYTLKSGTLVALLFAACATWLRIGNNTFIGDPSPVGEKAVTAAAVQPLPPK